MYTAGQPDPDLIIRTGGELRTSGFMLWQSAYTEYYITPTFWPDFGRQELYQALVEFGHRDRRFGCIKDDYGSPGEQGAEEEPCDEDLFEEEHEQG